jgi:hypothetical protein
MFCLPYYISFFSSPKLVIKAEKDVPGTEGNKGGEGWGGAEGRN